MTKFKLLMSEQIWDILINSVCFYVQLKYKRNRIERRLLLLQSSPQQTGSAVFYVSTTGRCKFPLYTGGFYLPHRHLYAQGLARDHLRSASDHDIVCFCQSLSSFRGCSKHEGYSSLARRRTLHIVFPSSLTESIFLQRQATLISPCSSVSCSLCTSHRATITRKSISMNFLVYWFHISFNTNLSSLFFFFFAVCVCFF